MKNRIRGSQLLRVKLISIAVVSCFATNLATANPTGPTVVNGTVAIVPMGNTLQITNTPNAIINWQSFSINAGEITRFIQQSQASAVLNRVIGQDPSSILGALQSNGKVFLINPNGILFGAGAQIDVAGLVASTLNLSNADFLAGRLNFSDGLGAGSVVNQGNITTQPGGNVYIVAPSITNSGIITSPKGEVILAAGNTVELVDPGTPNLRVEITAPDNQVLNLGQIVADSGRIGIYSGLISHSGAIRADSAVATEDGRIVLKAVNTITLEPGSAITVNGPAEGDIQIHSAAGDVLLNGTGIYTGGSTSGNVAISTLGVGKSLAQDADSVIRAGGLAVTANGDINLAGANQVGGFAGFTGLGGNLSFNNASPNVTVTGIDLRGGALAFNQTGNVFITGNVFTGAQTINASGNITIAPFGGPALSVFAAGPQTITAGGTLAVLGGSGPNSFAQITTSGNQNVSASNMVIAGGTGTGNFAQINHQPGSVGDQTIDAGSGKIELTGGAGIDGNFARITNSSGLQTVDAGSIALNGAVAGINSFTNIQGPIQLITTAGDVTLQGNAASNSGSRIGGLPPNLGGPISPTNLTLNVGGDLTLNGGSLGSNRLGGQTTDITVVAGGDITLNPGVGFDPRIGSPDTNIASGNISLAAGRNIALNSAGPGSGSNISTLGGVALSTLTPGMTITQGADSIIRADSLGVGANGNISLLGANQVGIFSGGTGLGGNLSFNNTSLALTVPGVSLAGGGALVLNQTGNLFITGDVSSGPQTIHASGDVTVSPFGAPGLSVNASGAQNVSADGTLAVLGGSGTNSFAEVTSTGPITLTTGNDLRLMGGSGKDASVLLFGNADINLTVGGALRLNKGAGDGAWARIQTATRDSVINVHFPNLPSGGYFVNDVEGAIRRGLTGFLSGEGAATLGNTLNVTYGQ